MKQFFLNNPLGQRDGESTVSALWRLFNSQTISYSFSSFQRHYYLWKAKQSSVVPGAMAA